MLLLDVSTLSINQSDFIQMLYDKYCPFIKNTILKTLKSSNNLPDLINDTFVKLISNVSTLQHLNEHQLMFYIYRTARTSAINQIQAEQKDHKFMFTGTTDDAAMWIADNKYTSLEEDFEDKLDYATVLEKVKQLPQKEKDLFLYRYYCNLPDKEIAKLMNIKPDYIRVYFARIKKKLAETEVSYRE